jgi:hypothetical protein
MIEPFEVQRAASERIIFVSHPDGFPTPLGLWVK